MAGSGEYEFGQNLNIDKIILESFERIGRDNTISPKDAESALRSANLELSYWASAQDMIYLRKRMMFNLDPSNTQAFFEIPSYVVRIMEVTRTNYLRLNSGGTAISSEGNAAPCFIAGGGGLIQTLPNGYIGYSFTTIPQDIWYVGVQPLVENIYKLIVEYSYDGETWLTAQNAVASLYVPTQINWLVLEAPPTAKAWRIRETGGAILAIKQVYFCSPNPANPDGRIGSMSASTYLSLAQKKTGSIPSSYYFNNKISNSLYLYGNNYSSTNAICYLASVFPQDLASLVDLPDVAIRYLEPLTAALAYRLSIKYQSPPPTVSLLKADYIEKFNTIRSSDREQVDITMSYNMGALWNI